MIDEQMGFAMSTQWALERAKCPLWFDGWASTWAS